MKTSLMGIVYVEGQQKQERSFLLVHLDDRHDVRFDGIKGHGHYCVPIIYQDRLLGVINLYITDGHHRDKEETDFLNTIANTLAGLIERKRMEEKVEELARYDSLTKLPNRSTFLERLSQEIARSKRESSHLSVLFLDLDHFKAVNDGHGHPVGDELLIQVSSRIKSCLRENDIVARFGGDEFCILLPSYTDNTDSTFVAKKIISALNNIFHIEGIECKIGSSIGIACFPTHGEEADELIRKSDIALYAVKNSGRNNVVIYNDELGQSQEEPSTT